MESRKDAIVDEMGLNMVPFQKAVLEKDAQHSFRLRTKKKQLKEREKRTNVALFYILYMYV